MFRFEGIWTKETDFVEADVFPLAGAQRFVWFHQRINPLSTAYNIGNLVHIRGALDKDAFIAAHDSMLARTDSVRLRFSEKDGEPFQWVGPFVAGHLPFWDFSTETDAEQCSHDFLKALEKHPFDLQRDSCYRYGLIRLAAERWIFFTFFHHLVIDALGGAMLICAKNRVFANNAGKTFERRAPLVASTDCVSARDCCSGRGTVKINPS